VIIVAENVKKLATYQSEIKALKVTEALKDKAIVKVTLPLINKQTPVRTLSRKWKRKLFILQRIS
jgi:hypothetical protein